MLLRRLRPKGTLRHVQKPVKPNILIESASDIVQLVKIMRIVYVDLTRIDPDDAS
jgi:hypothetical protein